MITSTCFLSEPICGEIRKEEDEIDAIRLFRVNRLPSKLAFEHSRIIEDYLNKVAWKQ